MIRLIVIGALLLGRAFAAGEVDPAKWAQLKMGMTESEVLSLLGEPLRREEPARNRWSLIYGEIAPKSEVFPAALAYAVTFDEKNTLQWYESPFGQDAPRNGPPGQPTIFLPQPSTVFPHYPRVFDVRWFAATGTYPMTYEVEHDSGYAPKGTIIWHRLKTAKPALPYVSLFHFGANPGRVRVRGINAEGPGPWSEYILFEFTH